MARNRNMRRKVTRTPAIPDGFHRMAERCRAPLPKCLTGKQERTPTCVRPTGQEDSSGPNRLEAYPGHRIGHRASTELLVRLQTLRYAFKAPDVGDENRIRVSEFRRLSPHRLLTVYVSSLAEQATEPGAGRRIQRMELNRSGSGRVLHRNCGLLTAVASHPVQVYAGSPRRLVRAGDRR